MLPVMSQFSPVCPVCVHALNPFAHLLPCLSHKVGFGSIVSAVQHQRENAAFTARHTNPLRGVGQTERMCLFVPRWVGS